MRALALAAVIALLPAVHAAAQTRDRFAVSLNGAFQGTENPFSDRFTFDANRETGSTETRYPVDGGPAFDGSLSVALWRNLGAGVAVSFFNRDTTVTADASVPHPFFFDSPRAVSGTADATRAERAIHAQATWRLRVAAPVTLTLSAGPSFLSVDQDVVTAVEYNEAYPYDTATFRRAAISRATGSALGFNVGADAAWMFSRHAGVGAVVRVARATVDLDLSGGRQKRVDAGGLSAGGGLRLSF